MSIWKYLKDSLWTAAAFALLILLADLFVAASTWTDRPARDIAYLDVLMLAAAAGFFAFDFYRWKNRYSELNKALARGDAPDFSLPLSDNLESRLMRDMTESKNREISARTGGLQNQLDELNDYITRWVHEIKIPISVCELIADRLQEETTAGLSGAVPEQLRMELERIKFLINQVLYAGRASSYADDLQVEECCLDKLVKSAVKRNAAFFIARNIDLRLGDLEFTVMTDKKWMAYILDQILNNSCKYVDDGGRIEICGSEDEEAVRLSVKDDGTGIAKKDLDRIFDRGFTGDNGRRIVKSTGMGLYFSKKIANKLGHRLEVFSEAGEYTRVDICIYKFSDYLNVTKM